MNPDYIRIIRLFRKRLPKNQIMMTSNGGGLLRPPGVVESLTQLFDAGLNIFAFDAYEHVKIKDKIDELLFADTKVGSSAAPWDFPFEIHRYPDEKEFSPHNRYGHKARKFIRIQDIGVADAGTHSTLNNHCGGGLEGLKKPLEARCAKPFRELTIRWDGNVSICCNDFRGVYKVASVHEVQLDELWNHERFQSARRFLMQGNRAALKPCDICDAKSYRVGLLPDKKGKTRMRRPNENDHAIVQRAAGKGTFTEVVLRPWEIKRSKRGN